MYNKIMVPVDMAHVDKMEKALKTASDLAGHYGASVTLVGVTGTAPSASAHNPEEFASKLGAFADEQGSKAGVPVASLSKHVHDVSIDLESALRDAAKETGADLIVMASHVPGFADFLIGSRAGQLASHVDVSVFVVR